MQRRNQEQIEQRDLELLEIIEQSPEINQRGLAQQAGMALGLANSCLKRLARKGMVKIQEAPGRRYAYYLTPKGMREKTRLTYEYVRYSVHFYGKARSACRALFAELEREGATRVAFLGRSELAEIAYLSLQECDLEFAGIYVSSDGGGRFFGHAPLGLEALGEGGGAYDALVYTGMVRPGERELPEGLEYREIF